MKEIFGNIKKYFKYILFSTKSKLKSEVASSYLNALWWFINPLSSMLIYMFVVEIVFKMKEPNFPIFVFIGITIWDYFSGFLNSSVRLIKDNKNIVTKVYIPKYILLIVKSFVMLFKMFISISLIFIMMFFFKVPITFNMLYFIVILIVLYLFTFGCSMILMNFGVYFNDLNDIVRICLKFVCYFSGIFYSIPARLPNELGTLLLRLNPAAFFINESRNVLLYNKGISNYLIIWFIISLILCLIGFTLIRKNENSYVKVLS